MSEKTIITGKKGRIKISLFGIAFGLIAVAIILFLINFENVTGHSPQAFRVVFTFRGYNKMKVVVPMILYCGVLLLIIVSVFYLAYSKVSITVTDKRVYGTAAWGKRVDLPLDKISAVATSFFHGIAVATSSGSIHFKAIINNEEVHSAISKLLMDRQEKSTPTVESSKASAVPQSNADELKKYKDLLDSGIITQEEFDAKKKQLLGL